MYFPWFHCFWQIDGEGGFEVWVVEAGLWWSLLLADVICTYKRWEGGHEFLILSFKILYGTLEVEDVIQRWQRLIMAFATDILLYWVAGVQDVR